MATIAIDTTNRRRASRIAVDFPVRINDSMDAHAINLSAGGLLLQSDNRLSMGQEVKLAFELDDQAYTVRARVVRIDHEGAALDFVQMSREVRLALVTHVARHNAVLEITRFIGGGGEGGEGGRSGRSSEIAHDDNATMRLERPTPAESGPFDAYAPEHEDARAAEEAGPLDEPMTTALMPAAAESMDEPMAAPMAAPMPVMDDSEPPAQEALLEAPAGVEAEPEGSAERLPEGMEMAAVTQVEARRSSRAMPALLAAAAAGAILIAGYATGFGGLLGRSDTASNGSRQLAVPQGATSVAPPAAVPVPPPLAGIQPAAKQPPAKQPAAKQPAANTPAANTPAANTPAANTPAAKQPQAGAGNADRLVAEGDALFRSGTWSIPAGKSALDRYREALRADPSNQAARNGIAAVVDGYRMRAEQQQAKGDRDGARWRYQRALEVLEADGARAFGDGWKQRASEIEAALAAL